VNLGLIIANKTFTRFCLKILEKNRLTSQDPKIINEIEKQAMKKVILN
jgi:hypothetical protein